MRLLSLLCLALSVFIPTSVTAEEPAAEPEFVCREPGLWMAKYGAEDFAKPYCDACLPRHDGERCEDAMRSRAAGRILTGPTTTKSSLGTKIRLGTCGEIDYQIQLIRAWHGRGLDDSAWEPYFKERFEWFGERERTSYPKPAPKLIRRLKKLRKQCVAVQKKYAKYLGPLDRLRNTGRVGRSVLTQYAEWQGMSSRALPWTGNPRSHLSLLLFDEARPISEWGQQRVEPVPESRMKSLHMTGPVSEEQRERKFHVLAQVLQNDALQRVGFTCFGECEGGYSLSLYLTEDGEIAGQEQSFSACPFVYTSADGMSGWAYQGEVLRDVIGAEAETDQTLPVQHERALCESGAMWVRIAEEKREITYLDDVALLVGGVEVKPDQCTDALAHCADDGQYSRLDQGDVLDLRFTIPTDVRGGCDDVEVWADGYYEQLPE